MPVQYLLRQFKYLRKLLIPLLVILLGLSLGYKIYINNYALSNKASEESLKAASLESKLFSIETELNGLKSQDQLLINKKLQQDGDFTHSAFEKASQAYESLRDTKTNKNVDEKDKLFASILKDLSDQKYASAESKIADLNLKIKQEQEKLASAAAKAVEKSSPPVTVSNNPPGSGYSRQQVQTSQGNFTISIISADIGSTRVIVDTASTSDCRDNCPVIPLVDYINRNGAYAGVNGAYYCPSDYPSCAGKVNSFDLLIMNKNKTYFNSDNNIYSTNPAVIFADGYTRFVRHAQEWGRDTNINSVISNFPLLVFNSGIAYSTDASQAKWVAKGTRSFVAARGNSVYIGVISNVTMDEAALVLHTLGMENAMNLDGGGSTALWYGGGYKAGPGRNLTNVILFVRK